MELIIVSQDEIMNERFKKIIKTLSIQVNAHIGIKYVTHINHSLTHLIYNHDANKIFIITNNLKNLSNGLDIIKLIRTHDIVSPIIYLVDDNTNRKDFPEELLIYKTIKNNHKIAINLNKVLLKLIKLKTTERFEYHTLQQDLSISYNAITYITRDKEERKLIIHTDTDYYKVNLTFKQIQKYLDNRFKMSHRSCLVNTRRVNHYDWHNKLFHLDSGLKINLLSKNYRENLILV